MRPDRYAALARWYDAVTTRLLHRAREHLVQLCQERGYVSLLDIGCGTGLLACELHRRGCSVTGVDRSPAMPAVAAGRRRGRGMALVHSALPLPFASSSFDAAILSLVLHESEDAPCALLTEALRVAPVCLVLEWRMPERNLDLPAQPLVHAIERLAGKAHYERFRHFAKAGYLHGLVHRIQGRVLSEQPLMGGTMVLAEVALHGDGPDRANTLVPRQCAELPPSCRGKRQAGFSACVIRPDCSRGAGQTSLFQGGTRVVRSSAEGVFPCLCQGRQKDIAMHPSSAIPCGSALFPV